MINRIARAAVAAIVVTALALSSTAVSAQECCQEKAAKAARQTAVKAAKSVKTAKAIALKTAKASRVATAKVAKTAVSVKALKTKRGAKSADAPACCQEEGQAKIAVKASKTVQGEDCCAEGKAVKASAEKQDCCADEHAGAVDECCKEKEGKAVTDVKTKAAPKK